jgi:adenylate cyclase
MPDDVQRKLTTILAADAEGYSRVMEADEVRALGALRAAREVFARFIERYHGRIANTAGDGLIAEFPSVVEAVRCAIEVQRELGARQGDPADALRFRIGIHLGDVLVDGDDLLGEGVNLAARLQAMAAPGDVLISQQVYDQVRAKLSVGFDYLGDQRPKNFAREVPVYRVSSGGPDEGERLAAYSLALRPATRTPEVTAQDRHRLRAQVIRHAKALGIVWLALMAIDLTAGPEIWVQWPGLAMAAVLGLEAAPMVARGRLSRGLVRSLVIVTGLALVNLLTWSGYPWALWPAAALLGVYLLRRLGGAARPPRS